MSEYKDFDDLYENGWWAKQVLEKQENMMVLMKPLQI